MQGTRRADEKYYDVAGSGSLGERLLIRARDKMFADFCRIAAPRRSDRVLDVGVSDFITDGANFLERLYPYPEQITACGLGDGADFKVRFPRVAYIRIEAGMRLPFEDRKFDIATANAVLEHVGSVGKQREFVGELLRVASRVFLTVPNRYFPVEHHTALPLLHWTDATFAWACGVTGKSHWALPENLTLMTKAKLRSLVPANVEYRIGHTGIRLGPMSSNLYLSLQLLRRQPPT